MATVPHTQQPVNLVSAASYTVRRDGDLIALTVGTGDDERTIVLTQQHVLHLIATLTGIPPTCADRRCTYYQFYLPQSSAGEPDLSHEVYHSAEAECLEAQRQDREWWQQHACLGEDGYCRHRSPYERECDRLEKLVRS